MTSMTSLSSTSNLKAKVMHIWQLQEAKAKLTEFVNSAKQEPQIISRHGKEEIVAISIELYKELTSPKEDIVTFFRNSPLFDSGIELERDQSMPREVEL